MNSDEARKCFEIAKSAVKMNQFDKAEKFLAKSIKLHDNQDA
jgi:hypothetical protein